MLVGVAGGGGSASRGQALDTFELRRRIARVWGQGNAIAAARPVGCDEIDNLRAAGTVAEAVDRRLIVQDWFAAQIEDPAVSRIPPNAFETWVNHAIDHDGTQGGRRSGASLGMQAEAGTTGHDGRHDQSVTSRHGKPPRTGWLAGLSIGGRDASSHRPYAADGSTNDRRVEQQAPRRASRGSSLTRLQTRASSNAPEPAGRAP